MFVLVLCGVCVYLHIYTWVGVLACAGLCGRQRSALDIFFNRELPYLFFDSDVHSLQMAISARLDGQPVPRIQPSQLLQIHTVLQAYIPHA